MSTAALTDPQRKVLEYLGRGSKGWPSLLADHLWPEQPGRYSPGRKAGYRAARAAQILHRLKRKGLVRQDYGAYGSGRWVLTDAGREALQERAK